MSTATSVAASSSSSCALSAATETTGIIEPWQPKRTSYRNVPELLRMRQTYGAASSGHGLLIGATAGRNGVSLPYLASRGAWNARRLQNTMLVVGPGTPASVVTAAGKNSNRRIALRHRVRASSSSTSLPSTLTRADEESEEQDISMGEASESEEDYDDDDDGDDDGSSRDSSRHIQQQESDEEAYDFLAARASIDSEDDFSEDGEDSADARLFRGLAEGRRVAPASVNEAPHYCQSMRHGGCINTASWLDTGWRLSTAGDPEDNDALRNVYGAESDECPTQLVTSGDDDLLKCWDVSQAMGSVSPLGGGSATICPFSASTCRNSRELEEDWLSLDETGRQKLRAYQNGSHVREWNLPGSVRLMSTIHTGHRANVFHITPLTGKAGVVATCGADGFLRLTDMESEESSIVVSPEYEDEISAMLPVGLLSLRRAMCYSHHFMNRNVGLLCSERGLNRFDLRIPPREQSRQRLLNGTSFRTCRACAILSAPSDSTAPLGQHEESSYVFVGGSSRMVALCDLRMTHGSQNRVVQTYCPSGLSPADHVSVSGLDLSRDRQELLVSYESDQIYTFPIFPKSDSRCRSVESQVEELEASTESPTGKRGKIIKPFVELATYGAHLNRFTFLKNARYAGPRDEYICTGSDSGHAWVYEKASGAVCSFWMADNSTCNGVVPHPTLPLFVTYGIDSTAKLWRPALPVDKDVDDSAIGRRRQSRTRPYNMSPVVRSWGQVVSVLENLDLRDGGMEQTEVYPDHIPSTKVLMRRGRLARSWLRDASGNIGTPKIGNDLHNLEQTLKSNLYTCLRSLYDDDDVPVESDIEDLKHRFSLIRLRYQADRLGLTWNVSIPWCLKNKEVAVSEQEKLKDAPEDHKVDRADLIPDYPSDWFPYDPEISSEPFDFLNMFNVSRYEDFFLGRYIFLSESNFPWFGRGVSFDENEASALRNRDQDSNSKVETITDEGTQTEGTDPNESGISTDDDSNDVDISEGRVKPVLLETMTVLKEAGNVALKSGNINVAAYRYDKAIQYAAIFYMKKPDADGGEWNQLRKTLVVTRLNLALVLLKPHFSELKIAEKQAIAALEELRPFIVFSDSNKRLETITRDEIFGLRAKAYFRLGCANCEMGDYSSAVDSFNESLASARKKSALDSQPDQLVLRRLDAARREQRKQNERQRKKLKLAFASATRPSSTFTSTPASSTSASSLDATRSVNSNATTAVSTKSDVTSSTSTAVISNKKVPQPCSTATRTAQASSAE